MDWWRILRLPGTSATTPFRRAAARARPTAARDRAGKTPASAASSPNESLTPYLAASPIEHVDAPETPLLVLATTTDRIAPVELPSGRLVDVLRSGSKTIESRIYDAAASEHEVLWGASREVEGGLERMSGFLARNLAS